MLVTVVGAGEEAATTLALVIVPLADVGGVVVVVAFVVALLAIVGSAGVVVLLLAVDVVVLTTAAPPADSSDEATAAGGPVVDGADVGAGMDVVGAREAGIEEARPARVAAAAAAAVADAGDDVSIGVGPPFSCCCASDALSGAADAGTESANGKNELIPSALAARGSKLMESQTPSHENPEKSEIKLRARAQTQLQR